MIPHSQQFNPYLEQEVLSASPLRLRWMLIRRAEELCGEVERLWLTGEDSDNLQASGWLIRIREIVGELLDGVQNSDNSVNRTVSDFYVFLLKLLQQVEQNRDLSKLKTLADLLHLENETWEAVVKKFAVGQANNQNSNAVNLGQNTDNSTEFQLLRSVDELLEATGNLNLEI